MTGNRHPSSIRMPVAAVTPAGASVSEAVMREAVYKVARCDVAQLAIVDGHT